MATNRQDTLDPALLRPGRLDRKIEFPNPSRRERRLIFQTVTSKMNLSPDVDLEDCEFVSMTLLRLQMCRVPTSCPRPKSHPSAKQPVYRVGSPLCTSDILAVRKNRYVILPVDFEEAWKVSGQVPPDCTTGNKNHRWCEVFSLLHSLTLSLLSTRQSTVKRSEEKHEFCEYIGHLSKSYADTADR